MLLYYCNDSFKLDFAILVVPVIEHSRPGYSYKRCQKHLNTSFDTPKKRTKIESNLCFNGAHIFSDAFPKFIDAFLKPQQKTLGFNKLNKRDMAYNNTSEVRTIVHCCLSII